MNIEQVLADLDKVSNAGKEWLSELETSRNPWFNVSSGDGFYHYHRSWNDDLSLPFAALPGYIDKIKSGTNIERPTAQLIEEREALVADYRELLDTDEDRATYDQLITLAHRVFPYVEGHKFYCEHWYTNLFFNKIREFGRAAARSWLLGTRGGCIPPHPVRAGKRDHRSDAELGHCAPPRGPQHWPAIVKQRAAAITEWGKHTTSPALGAVPDVIDDPAIVMLWGITRESLDRWLNADDDKDSKELQGLRGLPWRGRRRARVVKSVDEISRLQQGDILVCQVTNPTWAPIFQKISAAVSDIGGSMSRMAIVAREYGLPAVVGTGRATQMIPDGAWIRVDGGRGVVTILETEPVLEDA